ncbi:prolipoprotein diacylglyceryl transferase [Eubacteriaceae bacterium ES3]|nr:prolipoprotein diacylglyceryl transferase [Eubacteriaceae bacterium ES3]
MHPLIQISNLQIPSFGILFLIGSVAAFLLSILTARKYQLPSMDIIFFGLFGLVGGIIGAKLIYLLLNIGALITDPLNTLMTLMYGGSVFFGGLLGGILGGYFYCRIYKLDPVVFFDAAAPCIVLAQAFGRIGCFLNGCCYGIPYNGICSVTYPDGAYPPSGIALFPTQLTESFFLFIFCIFLLIYLKKSHHPGYTTGIYLCGYGFFRFLIEFLRNDPRGGFLFFSTSQWLGMIAFIIGILFFMNIPQRILIKHRNS